MAWVAASALALSAVLVGLAGRPQASTPAHQPGSSWSHLPWAAKGAISSSLGRDQAAFHVATRPEGLIARNSGQRLTADFGSRGVLVRSGATTFGLQLLAYGTAGHTTPVAPAAPQADANRVTYVHGAVTEWYANGPLGLEQGFDVRTPPATTTGGQLAIVLGLRGNAHARADGHGGLSLTGPGDQRLRYTGLTAVDARGRVLGTALAIAGGRAVIHVDTAGAVYPLRIDPFIQVAKFGDPSPALDANLGKLAISVQGTTAVAAEATTGFSSPHAVDVFVANSGRWELGATLVAQLKDPNPTEDSFGESVSLTRDETTLAVGAPNTPVSMNAEGAVFVFEKSSNNVWSSTPTAVLTDTTGGNAGDTLGKSVSISADGRTIAAGAPGRPSSAINSSVGAVDVFQEPIGGWANTGTPSARLTNSNGQNGDQLGVSVAVSGNGGVVVAGAWGSPNFTFVGRADVFQQPPAGWTATNSPSATLSAPNNKPGDSFGGSAAISADATTIVVGARDYAGERGAAFVFTSPDGTWPPPPQRTGTPAASATLMSSDGRPDEVGWSVAIEGRVIVSGTPVATIGGNTGQGAAYVFVEPPGGWASETETQRLAAGDGKMGDGLGQSVGISNSTVIAAAPFADSPAHVDQGFLYAFGSFPSTAISIAPVAPSGSNGWYVHPISLAVSASDLASTVTAIRCVLDPAAAPIGFGALPAACAFLAPGAAVSANGPHVLYAAAANTAGYTAAPVSQAFRIDTVGPRVVCTPPPNFSVHGRGGLVTATVSDATSGAAAPIVAVRANVARAGRKTVTLTGHDNAGNAASVKCRYTVTAPKVSAGFDFGFTRSPAGFTIITGMTAKKIQRGAKIKIDCKGGGCPFAHRTVKVPTTRLVCARHHKHCKRKRAAALQNINLEPLLANRHFAPHAVLTLAASKPNTIAVTSRFTIRANAGPGVTTTCRAPGAKKSGNC